MVGSPWQWDTTDDRANGGDRASRAQSAGPLAGVKPAVGRTGDRPVSLRHLGEDDAAAGLVEGEHEAVEKIGPPQHEGRALRVHEETTHDELYWPDSQANTAQPRGDASSGDATDPAKGQTVPIQAALSGECT